MEFELIAELHLTKLNSCLVVAVRAGGGLAAVLELQVAAVVLVELERGGRGEGQLGQVRRRRRAPPAAIEVLGSLSVEVYVSKST